MKADAMVSVRVKDGDVIAMFNDGTKSIVTNAQIRALPFETLVAAAAKGISESAQDAAAPEKGASMKKAAVVDRMSIIRGGSWVADRSRVSVTFDMIELAMRRIARIRADGLPEDKRAEFLTKVEKSIAVVGEMAPADLKELVDTRKDIKNMIDAIKKEQRAAQSDDLFDF